MPSSVRVRRKAARRYTGTAGWIVIGHAGIIASRLDAVEKAAAPEAKCLAMVDVRPATPGDLDAIVSGNTNLAEESEQVRLDRTTLRRGVAALLEGRAPGRYWVAELDGKVVGQLLITYEWSDWRNCMVWWIQSVYVAQHARRTGVLKTLYRHVRSEAEAVGAGGLRLYVDNTNTRAQAAYAALGMKGDHYRVFEDMFSEPSRME
jgi:GNAT superfamily N-acetyltransferase